MPQLALALRVLDAAVLWDDLRRAAGVVKHDPWATAVLRARRPVAAAVPGDARGWEYLLDGVEVRAPLCTVSVERLSPGCAVCATDFVVGRAACSHIHGAYPACHTRFSSAHIGASQHAGCSTQACR